MSHSEAEAVVGPVDQNLWIDKLHRALDATEDAGAVPTGVYPFPHSLELRVQRSCKVLN